MRDFNKVSPTLWQSSRFVDLPSDDGRFLYLYLLTCHHQNSAGCFWLPDGYACNDIRWEAKRYVSARQSLLDADLIRYDDAIVAGRLLNPAGPFYPSLHCRYTIR